MSDRNIVTKSLENKVVGSPDRTPDKADKLTILTERYGRRQAKRHVRVPSGWVTESYPANPFHFSVETRPVSSLDDLHEALRALAASPDKIAIRGEPNENARAAIAVKGFTQRNKESFDATPRRWVCIDVDNVILPGHDIARDPDRAVEHLVNTHFPPEFQNTRIVWQLSSSAGLKDPELVKCHLWCWLSRPLGFQELKAWRVLAGFPADEALFRDVQIHYVADPAFQGAPDPCARRWGVLDGEHDEIKVPLIDIEAAKSIAHARGESFSGMVRGKDVADILSKMGDGEGQKGFHAVILSAQMQWARTTSPGRYAIERETLKAKIREAARNAYRQPGRTIADVETYLTDSALDSGIDGAIKRAAIQI
ncbi:MAG: hypothetical protein ACRECY_12050, partial [Phyllobacterium sp.]